MTAEQPAHAHAFELLPWLVNGSLGAAERDAVERHVRTCIVCRREQKEQQRLHAAMRAQPTVHVSSQTAFEQLNRQLDETAAQRTGAWQLRYATVRPFAVAAAAGVALLVFLLWLTPLPQVGDGTFSTLATSLRADTTLLDVVFAEQTTAAEIQALLDEIRGEIVAGPSDVGRYSVRVADSQLTDTELTRLVSTLARDPRVRFAGRSRAEIRR